MTLTEMCQSFRPDATYHWLSTLTTRKKINCWNIENHNSTSHPSILNSAAISDELQNKELTYAVKYVNENRIALLRQRNMKA